MKAIQSSLVLLVLLAGCTFVGNSPMERKHRKVIQQEEDTFNRQKYERTAPAVEETDAYFTFTNRIGQRAREPMELSSLGKVMVECFGRNVAVQVVATASKDSVPDAAWFMQHMDQWLK